MDGIEGKFRNFSGLISKSVINVEQTQWRSVIWNDFESEKLLGIFLAVICFISYHYLKVSEAGKLLENTTLN